MQSRLLSAKLRSRCVVRLGHMLGRMWRRFAVAHALIHSPNLWRIVQRHTNDAIAVVQHAVLCARLSDWRVVGVGLVLRIV